MNSFLYSKQTTPVQYGTLLNLHVDKKKENQKCCKNLIFSKMSLFAAVFIFGGMNDLEER